MPSHIQEERLVQFAIDHGFIITPVGWKNHLAQYDKLGRCPCSPDRPDCPCKEAAEETKRRGHCLCSLFYSSYEDYIEICFRGNKGLDKK